MRIEIDAAGPVVVTLSKRNLLAGLHKLEMPESARMLGSGDGRLVLRFETDEEHYAAPAGTMHPDTEAAIAKAPRCGPFVDGVCQKCGDLDSTFDDDC